MNRTMRHHGRPIAIFLLLAVLLIAAASPGTAQEEPPPPPRDNDRVAPEREPEILEQQQTPDGVNTVLSIPVGADTYIASERPNENFGNHALFLGYNLAGPNNFGAERMLLHFDVESHIPDGSTINSALLTLHLSYSNPAGDAPMGTVLRRLSSPWTEYGVTWNTQPTWTPVNKTVFIGSELTWYEWDITTEVEGWITDIYPNDGVEIIGDERVQQRERAFYSRETSSSFYPQLIVDYTVDGDVETPIVTVDPLPDYSQRHFTVSWTGTDPGESEIAYYDVQVRVDGGAWQTWLDNVTVTEAEYGSGEHDRHYEFRARGVDNAGNVEEYGDAEAGTTVDTQLPNATVDPLPFSTGNDSFGVSWTGSDEVSGIQYYDVQYRYNNGPWKLWLPQTTATSATLSNAEDGLYEFEARAVDNVDQAELFTNIPEASILVDSQAPFIETRVMLPMIVD